MCLAQGPQRSDAGEPAALRSRIKHSTTEPLRSRVAADIFSLNFILFLYNNMCTYNTITSHTYHFEIQKRDSEESLLTFVNLFPSYSILEIQ